MAGDVVEVTTLLATGALVGGSGPLEIIATGGTHPMRHRHLLFNRKKDVQVFSVRPALGMRWLSFSPITIRTGITFGLAAARIRKLWPIQ